ncbi:hypothetical protein FO519_007658 [Halicephalobus sp. NKZ332]|nr:hypothetical protein FO519_007658 [Halicephalobus sp. NKZ332]
MDEMDRIRGVFFGQLIGDALGSRYEFKSSQEVLKMTAEDKRNSFLPILGGGPFNMRPGQVTDDSEMALSLMEALLKNKNFDQAEVAKNYVTWVESKPPDIGITTSMALWGNSGFLQKNEKKELLENVLKNVRENNSKSLSNGSLMRQSPLGIFFRNRPGLLEAVEKDTKLTHLDQTVVDASFLYNFAIAELIKGKSPQDVYREILQHSAATKNPIIFDLLTAAEISPIPVKLPDGSITDGHSSKIGYLGVAFQGAFYQLLHSTSFEKALEEVIQRGGDTDTNGCIAATLLGAKFGVGAIPQEWIDTVKSAKPRHPSLTFLDLTNIDEKIQALASL